MKKWLFLFVAFLLLMPVASARAAELMYMYNLNGPPSPSAEVQKAEWKPLVAGVYIDARSIRKQYYPDLKLVMHRVFLSVTDRERVLAPVPPHLKNLGNAKLNRLRFSYELSLEKESIREVSKAEIFDDQGNLVMTFMPRGGSADWLEVAQIGWPILEYLKKTYEADKEASKWIYLSARRSGDYFFDSQSLKKTSGDRFVVLIRCEASDELKKELIEKYGASYKNFAYTTYLEEINIKTKELRYVHIADLDVNSKALDVDKESTVWHKFSPGQLDLYAPLIDYCLNYKTAK